MRVLVTGVAGFIGFHVARRLIERGDEVVGVDNLNDYYDVSLKQARLAQLEGQKQFQFFRMDLVQQNSTEALFAQAQPKRVVHLAAQAGVRYSLTHPHAYIQSNVVAFMNILEGCRQQPVEHLVYASSSSVYGANMEMPFSTHKGVDHPLSLYAATKKANELMAHAYSHLYGIPATGLRFFTVYGPWGRPDMAVFIFTKAILAGKPIDIFDHGRMQRDLTYIDDIVEGIIRVLDRPAAPDPSWSAARPDPASSAAPYRLYNIGNHQPVGLMRVIELLEQNLGQRAEKRFLPRQPGDVPATYADIDDLYRDTEFQPRTPIEQGIERFVGWYREFYQPQARV